MGWQLQRSKCKAWIRGADALLPAVNSVVPQVLEGLPLLGSALEGELESLLGLFGFSAAPACGRLTAAHRFAEQIRKLPTANLDAPAVHAAWKLIHGILEIT